MLWLLGAAVATCGALSYAECASRLPEDGGFYLYYREAYGEWLAFVAGWSALLVTYPASIAAIAHFGAGYLQRLFPDLNVSVSFAALGLVALSGALNAIGLESGARTQRVLTFFKGASLLALCLVAATSDVAPAAVEGPPLEGSAVLGALLIVLWTFDGWSDVTLVTGHLADPARNLKKAVLASMATLAVLYVATQSAVDHTLNWQEASQSGGVFVDAVARGIGQEGLASRLVGVLIVICVFGSLHGIIFAAARLVSAMARAGGFFAYFAREDRGTGVPRRALAFLLGATATYVLVSDFRELLRFFGQAIWLFYGLTAVAVFILRRKKIGGTHILRAPSFAPVVVILAGGLMTASLAIEGPVRFLTGIGLIGLGVPVYVVWRRMQRAAS